jgi:hypothetical protein
LQGTIKSVEGIVLDPFSDGDIGALAGPPVNLQVINDKQLAQSVRLALDLY